MKIKKMLYVLLIFCCSLILAACQQQENQDKQTFAAQQLTRDVAKYAGKLSLLGCT